MAGELQVDGEEEEDLVRKARCLGLLKGSGDAVVAVAENVAETGRRRGRPRRPCQDGRGHAGGSRDMQRIGGTCQLKHPGHVEPSEAGCREAG